MILASIGNGVVGVAQCLVDPLGQYSIDGSVCEGSSP